MHHIVAIRSFFAVACVCGMVAFLAACSTKGMFAEIERERGGIAEGTSAASSTARGSREITWSAARRQMNDHNLHLRRSRDRIAELERQASNQWREWLPRPTFYVSLQNSFRELGDISSDSLTASLVAPLTIPNPVSQRARTYQYALQIVQARDSDELNRRRQEISLYRLFLDWEYLETQEQHSPGTGVLEQLIEHELRRQEMRNSSEERRQMIQQQLASMLNMPGLDLVPRPETLPRVTYEKRLDRIQPGVNHGLLATRLAAYEIQAAILRKRGMKLTRWPALNVSASMPSVYDSRRTDAFITDYSDQISLFGGLSQSFDVTGRRASDIRSAEENVVFVRDSIRQRLDSDARQWQRLKTRYGNILQREAVLESRLRATRNRGGGQGRASDDLENTRKLQRELRELKRAKHNLDMEIWLWDDHAWK